MSCILDTCGSLIKALCCPGRVVASDWMDTRTDFEARVVMPSAERFTLEDTPELSSRLRQPLAMYAQNLAPKAHLCWGRRLSPVEHAPI